MVPLEPFEGVGPALHGAKESALIQFLGVGRIEQVQRSCGECYRGMPVEIHLLVCRKSDLLPRSQRADATCGQPAVRGPSR